MYAAAPPGFRFGGEHLRGSASYGVRGAKPAGRQKILKISKKISQENGRKWIILGDFSKELKNTALNFRALDEKPNYVGNI